MPNSPLLSEHVASAKSRPVTKADVYYLLERFAPLTIWDALNLDAPGRKVLIDLQNASPHFNVYDAGSALIMTPKDLYSEKRTLKDAIQTADALTEEVFNRGWVIEMAGFEKLERAVWIKAQHLEDMHGKKLEILHFDPSFKDLRIYNEQALFYQTNKVENR